MPTPQMPNPKLNPAAARRWSRAYGHLAAENVDLADRLDPARLADGRPDPIIDEPLPSNVRVCRADELQRDGALTFLSGHVLYVPEERRITVDVTGMTQGDLERLRWSLRSMHWESGQQLMDHSQTFEEGARTLSVRRSFTLLDLECALQVASNLPAGKTLPVARYVSAAALAGLAARRARQEVGRQEVREAQVDRVEMDAALEDSIRETSTFDLRLALRMQAELAWSCRDQNAPRIARYPLQLVRGETYLIGDDEYVLVAVYDDSGRCKLQKVRNGERLREYEYAYQAQLRVKPAPPRT